MISCFEPRWKTLRPLNLNLTPTQNSKNKFKANADQSQGEVKQFFCIGVIHQHLCLIIINDKSKEFCLWCANFSMMRQCSWLCTAFVAVSFQTKWGEIDIWLLLLQQSGWMIISAGSRMFLSINQQKLRCLNASFYPIFCVSTNKIQSWFWTKKRPLYKFWEMQYRAELWNFFKESRESVKSMSVIWYFSRLIFEFSVVHIWINLQASYLCLTKIESRLSSHNNLQCFQKTSRLGPKLP